MRGQIGIAGTKSTKGSTVLSAARRSVRRNVVSCARFRCRVSIHDARSARWDASGSISVTRSPRAFARTAPSLAIK